MTNTVVGHYALAFAVLASGGALLASVSASASQLHPPKSLRLARWLIHAITALLTVACGVLLIAILKNDFGLSYVADNSEKALPIGYKIAALWAGHDGSLLLWAWMQAVIGSIAVILSRKTPTESQAPMIGILATICGSFAMLMLFTSDPFELGRIVPLDGQGMNPLLQNPAMIIHPPLLFLGYAGFAVPCALLLGALIGGRSDNAWVTPIRNWMLVAWGFLTAGIALGAWWAYLELGWGGYWAWDPVENASLLPWFTGTAALHSLIVHRRRGTLKVWNAALVPLTFSLCILATYLTRSGVISSVHAFPESSVGPFLLAMLLTSVVVPFGVLFWRMGLLRGERPMDRLISHEAGFSLANTLLLVMMLTTLVGTVFPLITKPFAEDPITLEQPFYNSVVVPMSLVLIGLMGLGPLLRYGGQRKRFRMRMLAPTLLLHATLVVAGYFSGWNRWTMTCAAVSCFAIVGIVQDVVWDLVDRFRNSRQGAGLTLWRALRTGHRRYGSLTVHLGVVMILIGVAGSSLYETESDHWLAKGQSVETGGYVLRFDGLKEVREVNFLAGEAQIALTTPGGGKATLRPQRRQYTKSEQPHTEVDLHSTLRGDVYTILAGWKDKGATVHVKVLIIPLVGWIWIGSMAMIAGVLWILAWALALRLASGSDDMAGAGALTDEFEGAAPAPLPSVGRAVKGMKK